MKEKIWGRRVGDGGALKGKGGNGRGGGGGARLIQGITKTIPFLWVNNY